MRKFTIVIAYSKYETTSVFEAWGMACLFKADRMFSVKHQGEPIPLQYAGFADRYDRGLICK